MSLVEVFEQLSLFHLPKASPAKVRHVHLGDRIVAFEIRQKGVRRLSMTIDERGLRVNAPRQVSLAEIEKFLHANDEWILRKLDEYARRGGARHLRIRDGVGVPLLGGEATVRVVPGANRVRWEGDSLVLAARPGADLDALAKRALQQRALEHFRHRTDHYAERLKLPAPAVALSSARTRWGSCSRKTGIRLNWRLIHLPVELGDYVVAHEVAHLIQMNHGPRFWAVVEGLDPHWQEARAELKRRAPEIPLV
jgi:predicted metal-dependent hydrolase